MDQLGYNLYKNQRITVMGLGQFGGGIGAARFLAGRGANVTVTDMKDRNSLAGSIAELDGLPIKFVLGRHEKEDFTNADMVVVSPAVPRESEYIALARRQNIPLTTEIGLFVTHCPAPVCGVTGSNGKTTTVSMIGSIMKHTSKKTWVGGNIGGSLLDSVDGITPEDAVVIELSSFQLEWLREMKWSPKVAAILNLTPNHLDRHGTFEAYREAKTAILDFQKSTDDSVLLMDDPNTRSLSGRVRSRLIWIGLSLDRAGITLDVDDWIVKNAGWHSFHLFDTRLIRVPGKHNILNAMAAAACANALGAGQTEINKGLAEFSGVPHRIEFVTDWDGIRFFNDSKATTPESTVVAVTSFPGTVLPILGGYDKGMPFDTMAASFAGRIGWAALIGTTAPAIARELKANGITSTIFDSLEAAIDGAIERAKPGDVVLLSPGCASYDMFPNYEVRGDTFKSYVRNLGA